MKAEKMASTTATGVVIYNGPSEMHYSFNITAIEGQPKKKIPRETVNSYYLTTGRDGKLRYDARKSEERRKVFRSKRNMQRFTTHLFPDIVEYIRAAKVFI